MVQTATTAMRNLHTLATTTKPLPVRLPGNRLSAECTPVRHRVRSRFAPDDTKDATGVARHFCRYGRIRTISASSLRVTSHNRSIEAYAKPHRTLPSLPEVHHHVLSALTTLADVDVATDVVQSVSTAATSGPSRCSTDDDACLGDLQMPLCRQLRKRRGPLRS